MTTIEAQLIERLKKLPPARVAEVVDFVDFLSLRAERAAAARRLSSGLAALDALKQAPISDAEVEAEVGKELGSGLAHCPPPALDQTSFRPCELKPSAPAINRLTRDTESPSSFASCVIVKAPER